MTLAIGFMLVIWALAIGLTLYGTYLRVKHSGSGVPHPDHPFALYPISILKPLKGVDEGLESNLESFFIQKYPEYELIFSVANASDPAGQVVRKLMAAYPEVPARLIIGCVEEGPNPKVNNLILSYEKAAYDWLLISDSNVRVDRDYLRRMAAHIENGIGIVTSVVAGAEAEGIGGHLEAIYLNTFYSRGMHLAAAAHRPCVVGKSMLFQRSSANRFGGLRSLARYLAEDYMAGEAMRKLGLKVVMAADPVRQHIGSYSFDSFWSRHLRWGRIRKAQAPLAFAIEPLFGALVSGLIGGAAFSALFGTPLAAFLVVHLAIWALCDYMVIQTMGVRPHFTMPLAWFLRETLSVPLWMHIASGKTVNWRGKRLTVQPGGLIEST